MTETVYITTAPNVERKAFSSLRDACKHIEVSEHSAYKGKRAWIQKDKSIKSIEEVELVRTKRKRK